MGTFILHYRLFDLFVFHVCADIWYEHENNFVFLFMWTIIYLWFLIMFCLPTLKRSYLYLSMINPVRTEFVLFPFDTVIKATHGWRQILFVFTSPFYFWDLIIQTFACLLMAIFCFWQYIYEQEFHRWDWICVIFLTWRL